MLKAAAKTPPRTAGMTPAECVIDVFGGIRSVGRAIGIEPSTVLRWGKRPGGRIPLEYLGSLLDAARRQDKRLTLEELVFGRPGISRSVRHSADARRPSALDHLAKTLSGFGCAA